MFTSTGSISDSVSGELALLRASPTEITFPGMYFTCKSYDCNRNIIDCSLFVRTADVGVCGHFQLLLFSKYVVMELLAS